MHSHLKPPGGQYDNEPDHTGMWFDETHSATEPKHQLNVRIRQEVVTAERHMSRIDRIWTPANRMSVN